jgi:hypothetical protein
MARDIAKLQTAGEDVRPRISALPPAAATRAQARPAAATRSSVISGAAPARRVAGTRPSFISGAAPGRAAGTAITTANAGALSATSAHSGRRAFNNDFFVAEHESFLALSVDIALWPKLPQL